MPELTQPNNDIETQGHEVYDDNMALAESLDEMRLLDERFKKRERFWRRGGPAIAIAPLLAAGALMATHTGKEMGLTEKLNTDIYALLGSGFLGLSALYRHDKNREKGQNLAALAIPTSHALSNSTQPWIARRLTEKAEDDLRAQRNRGVSN